MPLETITITLQVDYEYQEAQKGNLYTEELKEGVIIKNEDELLDKITECLAEKLKG